MADTKPRSIRVTDENWQRFCALPGTQNDVLRGLLDGNVEPPGVLSPHSLQSAQMNRIEDALAGLPEMVGATIREVSAELRAARGNGGEARPSAVSPPAGAAGFSIQCLHCGEAGRGSSKYATICFECKSVGHTGETRECPVCTGGSGI